VVHALLLRPGLGDKRIVCRLDAEWKRLVGCRLSPPFPLVPCVGLANPVDPTAKPVAVAIYIEDPFEAMRLNAVSYCYHLVLEMEPTAILETCHASGDNSSEAVASFSPSLPRPRSSRSFQLLASPPFIKILA
jgi:hypothetical protein